MTKSKIDIAERDRQAIVGIKLHYATLPNIVLGGVTYVLNDLLRILQDPIDLVSPTSAAKAAYHAAVAAEKSAVAKANAVYQELRTRVLSDFKAQPQTLADFGMTLTNKQVPDAQTVAEAVQKRDATRKARHTMGKRQKAKIKGTVPETAPPATKPA